MGFFGLGTVVRHIAHGSPWLHVMRVIGISALLANPICVILPDGIPRWRREHALGPGLLTQ